MRKVLKVFKSKPFLVLMVIIVAPLLGAGVSYLTTGKGSATDTTNVTVSDPSNPNNPLYKKGDKSSDSLTNDSSTTDDTSTTPSTTTPTTTPKPKTTTSTQSSTPTCDTSGKNTFYQQYLAAQDTEDTRHSTWLQNNPDDGSNPNYSNDFQVETDTNYQNLKDIKDTYNANLASINC